MRNLIASDVHLVLKNGALLKNVKLIKLTVKSLACILVLWNCSYEPM